VLPELLKLSPLFFQYGIVPPTINHFTDDDENIDPKLNFTFNVTKK
jgi:3-oxoacyl-[acyl-carrier-protein] synthase II